jgi:hypothetical protein
MLRTWFGIALVVALAGLPTVPQLSAAGDAGEMSYEQFMRLDAAQRVSRFQGLTPQDKARLKRTHAEHWLAGHRDRLNARQLAAVENAVAFISPDLYERGQDAASKAREERIKSDLQCSLSHKDVMDAFTFWDPAPQPALGEMIDEWLSWFSNCVTTR